MAPSDNIAFEAANEYRPHSNASNAVFSEKNIPQEKLIITIPKTAIFILKILTGTKV
jgi:hypothetical protein